MSQPDTQRIQPDHVIRQFARRNPLDEAQFLYGEIAQRMLQRLSYIRIQPHTILDAGCGNAHALEPLRSRYPDLDYIGLDACQPLLDTARQRYAARPGFWQRLRNRPTPPLAFVHADMAATDLTPESVDLVWSNMALHWHPEPSRVMAEWRRLLRPEGLAMFSILGPGSLVEIRDAIGQASLNTTTPPLLDMHDYGDLLLQNGFLDPVMDQETFTLTYRTATRLLEDLRLLGGNPSIDRHAGMVSRSWRQRLVDALEKQRHQDGTIHLTIEVAYGHAWRAKVHQTGATEFRISAGDIKRAPGSRAGRPGVRFRGPEKK
ncbi:MAG TPA: methyltransferase domain-containing protein [Burkholderiaceae bacterium]|nr:methyltransferase domain-containing protein [Burkholderiaceae bacterium]